MFKQALLVLLVGVVCEWPRPVSCHGRLWTPPSRSSMWRQGYSTPHNYQDNELFCGGFQRQLSLGYKCGTCGDPYDGVRENEAGGKYATGVITRTFHQGQQTTFQVDLTANHKGFFEFKLCPTNDYRVRASQECFDRYPVHLADGSGSRFYVGEGTGMVDVHVQLPAHLSCDFCVLQWRYHAGNSWGTDPDGTSCVGCGPQEEFYGCADIRILADGSATSAPTTVKPTTVKPTTVKPTTAKPTTVKPTTVKPTTVKLTTVKLTTVKPTTVKPTTTTKQATTVARSDNGGASGGDNMICSGVNGRSDLDSWCQMNCQMGYCPPSHCTCQTEPYPHTTTRPQGCRAAGIYATISGYDLWCQQNCAAGFCPSSICVC